jgi:Icc-related predicted phosphoesterase
VIRIAAVGDIHYSKASKGRLRAHFEALADRADLLFVAGDLTQSGSMEEAEVLVQDLSHLPLPVVAVLGNHDYHQNNENEILSLLRGSGIEALEGGAAVFTIRKKTVGVVGLKGFGGGFFGACITEFGEAEVKNFARCIRAQATALRSGLENLFTDYKFALLHFSPVEGTLLGERKEIYPFLGSYLLAEAIDATRVDAVFHGHAHQGSEKSYTPGGVPVRNVAQSVIQHAYKIYTFDKA